ncbi:MAG TPA: glycine zipper family protein [Natronincola sp.]|nr:glycine zipper family protein [Natronincola sp.]
MAIHREEIRHFAGPGVALGAAVGVLFSILLGKSTALGILIGAALGFIIGASIDAVKAR